MYVDVKFPNESIVDKSHPRTWLPHFNYCSTLVRIKSDRIAMAALLFHRGNIMRPSNFMFSIVRWHDIFIFLQVNICSDFKTTDLIFYIFSMLISVNRNFFV